jgi:malate/lactate dehydrogenase
MTTKEKIIKKSIEQVQRKLKEVDVLLESNPASEIICIRMEAQKLLNENTTLKQRTSSEFISKLEALSKREKEQFALAEKGKDSIKLIDQKVKLEFELSDLRNELYYIERGRVS